MGPPICRSAQNFLTHQLGRGWTAPLTGQDSRALLAFVHVLDLYACADPAGHRLALDALRALVRTMQPTTRHLAKASVRSVLSDLGDEARLCELLGFAP